MDYTDLIGFSAAMSAAVQTGLLAQLIEGSPRTVDELATAAGTDPRATKLVLDVLTAFGSIEWSGDRASGSADLKRFADSPGGLARTLAMWAHAPAFLQTGAPFVRMDVAREELYAGVVLGLAKLFAPAARELAAALDGSPRRILDIGCGSGVWGLAIGERFTGAQVTGLDLPAVLEAFRTRAAEVGLADRIATLPGDVHEVAIPHAFDLVIVANVLRIEAPERARNIVTRAAAALEPGGSLVIVDAIAGGTPERERARTVYALHLGMRTDHGRVYSRDEIGAWLTAAGLHDQRVIELAHERTGAVGAIVAR